MHATKASAESAPPAVDSALSANLGPATAQSSTEMRVTPRRWYGWQTLSFDAASLTVGVVGVNRIGEHRPSGILMGSIGLTGYTLGPPLVHWLQDQPGRAATSLALRVGLPLIAVGLVSATSAPRCPAAIEQEDNDYCRRVLQTMAVVGSISMLAASAIDAAALSWQPEVRQHKLALAPVLGWDGARGGVAGLAGVF